MEGELFPAPLPPPAPIILTSPCITGKLYSCTRCSLYMKLQHPVLTVTSSLSDSIYILVFYLGLLHSCSVLCICLYLMGSTCNAGERLDLVLV